MSGAGDDQGGGAEAWVPLGHEFPSFGSFDKLDALGLVDVSSLGAGLGATGCLEEEQSFSGDTEAKQVNLTSSSVKRELSESVDEDAEDCTSHECSSNGGTSQAGSSSSGHGRRQSTKQQQGQGQRPLLDKRRLERNSREKRRSLKISQHISELREVLTSSGLDCKTSKSTILEKANAYIRQLLQKLQCAEAERAQYMQMFAAASSKPAATPVSASPRVECTGGATCGAADYHLVFHGSPVPQALASVDGNIMDCNGCMCEALSVERDELLRLTLFNLMDDSDLQESFLAISQMLSEPAPPLDAPPRQYETVCWSKSGGNVGILCVSLVRDILQQPKCFSLVLQRAKLESPAGD